MEKLYHRLCDSVVSYFVLSNKISCFFDYYTLLSFVSDFGFFGESVEKMKETIIYWLDFYKQQGFIRFSIIDKSTNQAVGTIEGFGGETGVLRVDIASNFEKRGLLCKLFDLAKKNFREIFGNEFIVTKTISQTAERRAALEKTGWEYIGKFREYENYYQVKAE